jgi:hypothetical protein
MNNKTHTKDILAQALRDAGLGDMSIKAAQGYYHDFLSPLATPELTLMAELAEVGTPAAMALRKRVMNGDFDATKEESDEWAKSEAGQAIAKALPAEAREALNMPLNDEETRTPIPEGRQPIEGQVADVMHNIASRIGGCFEGSGYGFTLLVFPTDGRDGRMNYISSAERGTMITALKELVANFEGRSVQSSTKQ